MGFGKNRGDPCSKLGSCVARCLRVDGLHPELCTACKTSGVCASCNGEGGWVVDFEYQPQKEDPPLFREYKECPLCGPTDTEERAVVRV